MQKLLWQIFKHCFHKQRQLAIRLHSKLLLMLKRVKLKLKATRLMLQLLWMLFNNTRAQLMTMHLTLQALKELQKIAKTMLIISTGLH